MSDDHHRLTPGDEVDNKECDHISRSSSIYNDAASAPALYTIDDIDDANEEYSDCLTEIKEVVVNHGDENDAKGSDDPVYFVLEKTKTSEFPGESARSSVASTGDIEKAFDSNPDSDQTLKPEVTNTFENDFIADHDIPKRDDPFADFTDVEKCQPIYEMKNNSSEQLVENALSNQTTDMASTSTIYEMAGPFINNAETVTNPAEPVYETAYEARGRFQKRKQMLETKFQQPQRSIYELASPIPAGNMYGGGTMPGYASCKQGTGRPVSVKFLCDPDSVVSPLKTLPTRSAEGGGYSRLQLSKAQTQKRMKPQSQKTLESDKTGTGRKIDAGEEKIYEDVYDVSYDVDDYDDDSDGWGSSEFEEYSENEEVSADIAPDKPLPPKPKKEAIQRGYDLSRKYYKLSKDYSLELIQQVPVLLNKVNVKVASLSRKDDGENEEHMRCFPVDINPDKHPPPELPAPPDNLSENQKKRRCVIELIISSEKSYVDSLHRITEDYEKTVLSHVAGMKSHAKIVFLEAHQLLSHHKMFEIELSDKVARWDTDEKIGDIFTASFSRSMLVESYSTYVNSFAAAMEEIKTVQRMKPVFSDFLKAKEREHKDRLSLFGLMVKPVQRFPQFIMLLQDLLKYTPRDHHDRGALQLALTELENVTHQLNERKRRSEQQFLARQITNQVIRQLNQIANRPMLDRPKRLLRQDNLEQVVGESGQLKTKDIRLLLMDDTVLCAKVGLKEHDGYRTERYRLKWAASLKDLEIKDSAITADMKNVFSGGVEKFHVISSRIEKPEEDPFNLYSDLREMVHDHNVLCQIQTLMSSLKRPYQGLTEELIQELVRDLQQFIRIKDEQLQLVNSCTIILCDISKSENARYMFQTPTPTIKHDWCMDFLIAKLALEKQNNPGWDVADSISTMHPTYFMKCLPVDVPRNYTKMKCAIPVFHSSSHLGVQYLWVCSTTATRGQVAIVSIHNIKPSLTECFKASDCEISCMELVQGYGTDTEGFMFADDTVWLATEDRRILVFLLTNSDGMKREAVTSFMMPAQVTKLKYLDDKVFCGQVDGSLAIISRENNACWNVSEPVVVSLGSGPVTCLQIQGEDLWAAVGTDVHVVDVETLTVTQTIVLSPDCKPVDCIVQTGVGLWVSYKDSAVLQLYHAETFDNLQEINVASAIIRLLEEKSKMCNSDLIESCRSCTVTSLSVSKGILWIGTSPGFILTLPLPRLRDGVPLASGRPNISLHGHRGPVKFLLPIYYSSSVAEFNRSNSLWSSLRKRSKVGPKIDRSNSARGSTDAENSAGGFGIRRGESQSDMNKKSKSLDTSVRREKPLRTKTLSFRSELASKIAKRATSGVDFDSVEDDEVRILYENLLESDNEIEEEGVNDNNDNVVDDDDETAGDVSDKTKSKTEMNKSSEYQCRSSRTLKRGVTLLRSGTMHGTMKKNPCNSVIVVSGGDGYCDWNKPGQVSKVDDASLMMWIYKI